MSASITLRCNTVWRETACASAITTYASTTAEARTAARDEGWRSHPSDVDYCPACSGMRNATPRATFRMLPKPPRQRGPRP
ncbi:hypothetical protein ABZ605_08440 [Streptomyces sp. NPDC012765]|uniref:hypothetical protein n=1 Tax=Streptomyces sp. NPDC012765 TaxID=3155249 RepID=UPI003410C56A